MTVIAIIIHLALWSQRKDRVIFLRVRLLIPVRVDDADSLHLETGQEFVGMELREGKNRLAVDRTKARNSNRGHIGRGR